MSLCLKMNFRQSFKRKCDNILRIQNNILVVVNTLCPASNLVLNILYLVSRDLEFYSIETVVLIHYQLVGRSLSSLGFILISWIISRDVVALNVRGSHATFSFVYVDPVRRRIGTFVSPANLKPFKGLNIQND